ncbi:MAG: DUF4355 domain-containing protein [Gordonibacter sp.]|uniref:DUF4355 domain-containing protein n=1 Tax=Gordonibacter sp. TaxID=1968902 RepID=UPI002FC6B5AF
MPNRQKFSHLDGKPGDPAQIGAEGSASESGEDEGESGEEGGSEGEGESDPAPKYTDDDVDGIVEKRLARERAKLAKDIRKQMADEAQEAQTEAQKLESMTELQRAKYEADQLRKEKAELERKQNLSDQMAVARKELNDSGIAICDELLEVFVAPDAETTGTAIDKIKELWPQEVNKAVQAALKRKPPDADKGHSDAPSYGASYAANYSKQMMNGGI